LAFSIDVNPAFRFNLFYFFSAREHPPLLKKNKKGFSLQSGLREIPFLQMIGWSKFRKVSDFVDAMEQLRCSKLRTESAKHNRNVGEFVEQNKKIRMNRNKKTYISISSMYKRFMLNVID
jgi:hypothetical protein